MDCGIASSLKTDIDKIKEEGLPFFLLFDVEVFSPSSVPVYRSGVYKPAIPRLP
jgi:hypothetical protein